MSFEDNRSPQSKYVGKIPTSDEVKSVLAHPACVCKPSSSQENEDWFCTCRLVQTSIDTYRGGTGPKDGPGDSPPAPGIPSDGEQVGQLQTQRTAEASWANVDRLPRESMEASQDSVASARSTDDLGDEDASSTSDSSESSDFAEIEMGQHRSSISVKPRNRNRSKPVRRAPSLAPSEPGLSTVNGRQPAVSQVRKRKRSAGPVGSSGSGREGNTKPLSSSVARIKSTPRVNPAKKWVFTDYGSKGTRFEKWILLMETKLEKLAFQQEVCPLTQRVHLQGCFTMKKKGRPITELKMHGAHYELQRGTDFQAVAYAQKLETRLADGVSYQKGYARPITLVTYEMLRADQQIIADTFATHAAWNNRVVNWFYEPDGAWGKSFLGKYLVDQRGALMLAGSHKDLLYGYAAYVKKHGGAPDIVVFDIPRVNVGGISYRGIEDIQNGCFFSPKYEGEMIRADAPHICVFSNTAPEEDKLSADRWNIVRLQ